MCGLALRAVPVGRPVLACYRVLQGNRTGTCVYFAPRFVPVRKPVLACCRALPSADWAALDAAGQQLLRRLQLALVWQHHIAAEQAAVAGAPGGAGAGRSREVSDGLMASAHTNNALLGSGQSLAHVLCCFKRDPA